MHEVPAGRVPDLAVSRIKRFSWSRTGVLEVDAREWRTPLFERLAGEKPRRTKRRGDARFVRTTYGRGYYHMEGIEGFDYYQVVGGRLPVVALQRRGRGGEWKTWMVDDPLHWLGMRERVLDLPPGRVLCAGLGLGLMVHHLVAREDVSQITVVEVDKNVVELVSPTLPSDPRVTIVIDDYYRYIRGRDGQYDSVLWDLAVGSPDETRNDFLLAQAVTSAEMPSAVLSCFGLRRGQRTYFPEVVEVGSG